MDSGLLRFELFRGIRCRNNFQTASLNMSNRVTPGDFLKQAVGQEVRVRLNNGTDYRGNLTCLDGFLNIAMENTKEYTNGAFQKSYGDSFVRGNNVVYIATPSTAKSP